VLHTERRAPSRDLLVSRDTKGCVCIPCFFLFNDPATTDIYTLSLHDALPIFAGAAVREEHREAALVRVHDDGVVEHEVVLRTPLDRKSTRLNSSHLGISYAVFCLKKKTTTIYIHRLN